MGAHWYRRGDKIGPHSWAATRYVQKRADGQPSKVVKREKAFEDGAMEGVTSILHRVGDPSGLIWWYLERACETSERFFAAGTKAVEGKTLRETLRAVVDEDAEEAAEFGKKIHACIEVYTQTGQLPEEECKVERTACIEVGRFLQGLGAADVGHRSEVCAVYDDGIYRFGGTADFANPEVLVDWKTTTKPRKVYGKEVAQVAAYQKAFCAGGKYVANVYISQKTGMIEKVVEYTTEQLDMGWRLFQMCATMDALNRGIEVAVNPKAVKV